jgi:cytochrome b6
MTYFKNIFSKRSRTVIFLAAIVVGLLLLAVATHQVMANSYLDEKGGVTSAEPNWSAVQNSAAVLSTKSNNSIKGESLATVPAPEQSPCLSCHITGSNTGLWTPLSRWVLFGTMGLIFVFGIVKTGTVIVTRSPWKPLTTRSVEWVDERYQISEPMAKILSKPVPKFALHWWYCLGGITLFLFVIQAITGIMLAFYYKPTPEAALASIQYIETQVRFGSAIRAIHHWAANGMIVMCIAHMLRVFIMGVYKAPREMNWVSGFVLLILTLVFGFTGYLLPWDQTAYWASTVGTSIGGAIPIIGDPVLVFLRVGWDVTGETLSRFFALHVMVVPIITIVFMVAHFFMIRRQGIAKPL